MANPLLVHVGHACEYLPHVFSDLRHGDNSVLLLVTLNHVLETFAAVLKNHVLHILAVLVAAVVDVKHLHTVLAVPYAFQHLEFPGHEFARLRCPFDCHLSLIDCVESLNDVA